MLSVTFVVPSLTHAVSASDTLVDHQAASPVHEMIKFLSCENGRHVLCAPPVSRRSCVLKMLYGAHCTVSLRGQIFFDESASLNGHVHRAVGSTIFEWLRTTIHQSRHFVFSNEKFLAPELNHTHIRHSEDLVTKLLELSF